MSEGPSLLASGDINIARFVKISGNHTVAESDAANLSIGISHEDAKEAPVSGASALHAQSGDNVRVHFSGETCKLELGTGGATAGDLLTPDADGKGVGAATGEAATAIAFETGVAGDLVEVRVIDPFSAP